jgi:hypothetical protein
MRKTKVACRPAEKKKPSVLGRVLPLTKETCLNTFRHVAIIFDQVF